MLFFPAMVATYAAYLWRLEISTVDQVGILNHGKLLFEGSLQLLQKHSRGGILLRVLDAPKATAVLQQQGVKEMCIRDRLNPLGLIAFRLFSSHHIR